MLVAAELVDRSGEPFGDLPLPADLDLPPRRDDACDQQQTADGLENALEQGGPGVLLESGLGLPQLNTLLSTCHALQLPRRQRRVQPPRKYQHTRQDQCQRQHGRDRKGHEPACWLSHPELPLSTAAGIWTDRGSPSRSAIVALRVKRVDKHRDRFDAGQQGR